MVNAGSKAHSRQEEVSLRACWALSAGSSHWFSADEAPPTQVWRKAELLAAWMRAFQSALSHSSDGFSLDGHYFHSW